MWVMFYAESDDEVENNELLRLDLIVEKFYCSTFPRGQFHDFALHTPYRARQRATWGANMRVLVGSKSSERLVGTTLP